MEDNNIPQEAPKPLTFEDIFEEETNGQARGEDIFRALIRIALKELQSIENDEEALEVKSLYPQWDKQIGEELEVGKYINYDGILYKVLQTHTSQESWNPINSPSLFAKVNVDPTGETILEWQQPDSTNPYMTGDKVIYKGAIYISLIDNNVWSPADYPAGWQEVTE